MSRLRSTAIALTVAAATIGPAVGVGASVAAVDEAPSRLAARDDGGHDLLTPIGLQVAAQLHWWCLDQPRPTPCL